MPPATVPCHRAGGVARPAAPAGNLNRDRDRPAVTDGPGVRQCDWRAAAGRQFSRRRPEALRLSEWQAGSRSRWAGPGIPYQNPDENVAWSAK